MEEQPTQETVSAEDFMPEESAPAPSTDAADPALRAVLEALIYVTDEPLTRAQIAAALNAEPALVDTLLAELTAEFEKPEHGVAIREVAGGFKMATKAEHHDAVRNFVKSLKPPLKLSLAALETLSVIAYKQPITAPEVMEIRGVQGAGVLKTLLERKLIAASGRKQVVGKPVLYKTTKEFLIQFGLKDVAELPTLKEFEELRRLSIPEGESPGEAGAEIAATATEQGPESEAEQFARDAAGAARDAESEADATSPEATADAPTPADPTGQPADEKTPAESEA